ncbi:kinesin, putative [Leishmania tarentolae]|uniref:Kinesin, putative n=1 Tax=Leishmania tarentolae TaxID=5689 RepID=A0A640KBQ4_LEITA|nr:kinesin, putative [Leishmania tarentolae]
MKEVGGTSRPVYDSNENRIASTHGSHPLRRGSLPWMPSSRFITTESKCADSARRPMTTGFRIVVAARIRPFTEFEVHQWRQERRATAEEREDATAGKNGSGRSASRQPFGPENKFLNAASLVTTTHAGAALPQEPRCARLDVSHSSPDVDGMLLPVVEVESNGRTIVLLDRQRRWSDTNATAPVRNAFTYDYVYSSFTPRVELDSSLKEGLAMSSASVTQASGGDPDVLSDATKDALPNRASCQFFSAGTPEQERQAEAEQVAIYEHLAIPLVDAALQGYNTCMFAYGQTGSGKTYTMIGTSKHPGLIPRLCQLLLSQVAMRNAEVDEGGAASPSTRAAAVALQLSYMEIYNEQVRDLLKQRPKNAVLRYRSRFDKKDMESDEFRTLKVRHHPSQGIYVEGLTTVPVSTWAECEAFLQHGNALRTQYSTTMNAKSSRSHAIFQFQITQREDTGGRVRGREVALEMCSKINLVDLAGSERNTQSKATGRHITEANSINASLSTLRRVLEGLVNNCGSCGPQALTGGGKVKKGAVIPYRESLLTYVLSDNLGGNSFTVMCANISPSVSNISETESTLRYATLARGIVNHARLNEAPTALIIREMREQIKAMQKELQKAPNPVHIAELKEGMLLSEQLLRAMREREKTYELQLQSSEAQQEELRKAVASHQAREAYWRAEAERQQEELESLRAALATVTTGRAAADAISNKNVKSVSHASEPCHSIPPDPSLHLPQLSQGTGTSGAKTVTALPFSAEDHCHDGKALSPMLSPSNIKKKQSAKTNRRRFRGDGETTRYTTATYDAATDLYSPEAHQLKPYEARGTLPSLIGLCENTCLPDTVRPHVRRSSSASASCNAHRENGQLQPEGTSPQQHSTKNLPRRTLSSEQWQRSPHPPSQLPERNQYSSRAPIRGPPLNKYKGDPAKPTRSISHKDAPKIAFATGGHRGFSALHNGGSGCHIRDVAWDSDLSEPPSVYQTATYLTAEGAAFEGSSSVSTLLRDVSLKEGAEENQIACADDGRWGEQRPVQQQYACKKLYQPRASTQQGNSCSPTKELEIEVEVDTPTSSGQPTNSPRTSEELQAQATWRRRHSPVNVESAPSKNKTKASQGIDHTRNTKSKAMDEGYRLPPLPPLPPPQQQANNGGGSVEGAAQVDVRETVHRQSAAALLAREDSDDEYPYVYITGDGDVISTTSHPQTFCTHGGAGVDGGCIDVFEDLTDVILSDC